MPQTVLIEPHSKDLGGFLVRRTLPSIKRRMVGPFVFIDHMGPAQIDQSKPMSVRPHPHIGLSTLTYLFDGVIHHKDSLGSAQDIEPGAINWMTAGRGIVHSERSPNPFPAGGLKVHGLQCWIALPADLEECEPRFEHFPASQFPTQESNGIEIRVLLGSAFGVTSSVEIHSRLLFVELNFLQDSSLSFDPQGRELGVYPALGSARVNTQEVPSAHLWATDEPGPVEIQGQAGTRLILLGGDNIGPRFIWWNLVSSSKERLEQGRNEWRLGPRPESQRFQPVPGDSDEFIPSPDLEVSKR